jgi:hypothetical protein
MNKTVKHCNRTVRLRSYESASNKNVFCYTIEVVPEIGVRTPDWNRFDRGYTSLKEATDAMLDCWKLIKGESRENEQC